MQGGVDHHQNEREGNTAAAQGKLQYMRLSPDGSSMMSMEEQEGVYYGGSTAGGVGGDMQMGTWEHYNIQAQEGQSMMMMLKKRRLTNEQVKSLEVNFERESKLEAERKKELAQELGLQPRQVAVWFQNRRARFKTKQLERDFYLLKHQYDAVRSEKDKLFAQVAKLKGLLDAQSATSKGTLLTPADDTQGKHDMDEDQKVQHLSPERSEKQKPIEATEGTRKQNATATRTGKQKAISSQKSHKQQQHGEPGDVLSSENSDQTHVRATILGMDQPPKSLAKSSFTLEVKPSLQVPHVDHNYYHHHQQQQHQRQFPNTLSPPTKLSLCSPQQLFLHHMVAMKMEGDNFNPQHEPHSSVNYNDHYNFHHNHDEGDGSESMLCFNSTWHHDP